MQQIQHSAATILAIGLLLLTACAGEGSASRVPTSPLREAVGRPDAGTTVPTPTVAQRQAAASATAAVAAPRIFEASGRTDQPTAAPASATATGPAPTNMIVVSMYDWPSTSTGRRFPIGTRLNIRASFQPTTVRAIRNGVSTSHWNDHPAAEMRVCTALDSPCQLGTEWKPFATEQDFPIDVEWHGPRTLWLVAEFRDAQGRPVVASTTTYHNPAARQRYSLEIRGYVDEATPIAALPAQAQTAVAEVEEAFPVHGSVSIEDGRSMVGGVAGEPLLINVAFAATSAAGEVTEMRVEHGMLCPTEAEMASHPWQPFAPTQAYTFTPPLNIVGLYSSVQYRDEQGNLSQVYCDDISVEGSPQQ